MSTDTTTPDADATPDADVFELVVDRDAVVDYAGYGYAAYWQRREITAGRYPVRVVTIHHGEPFTHDGPDQTWGKPYYAIAELPAVVKGGHTDLEKPGTEVTHHVCAYHYELTDGQPVVYAIAEGDSPLPVPVGYFRKVAQAAQRADLARSLCASDRCRVHAGGTSRCPVPGASDDEDLRDL